MTKRALTTLIATAVLLAVATVVLLRLAPWNTAAQPPDLRFDAAGEYQVGVWSSPDPARTGENAMTVVVRDRDGHPVHDARVEAMISMEAMGAMPRMESRATVKRIAPGVSQARFGLAMLGDWDVAIRVSAPDRPPAELSYRLSTSIRGLAFESGMLTPGAAAGTAPGAAADTALGGVVQLDEARRQALGIRTEVLTRRDLTLDVKAPGRVAYDEARSADVSLKYAGWVRDVGADFTGRRVRKHEILFTAYSPELVSTQQEYLEAIGGGADTLHAEMGGAHQDLAAASRRRLLLWDVPASVIDDLDRTQRALDAVPVLAPIAGVVVEKNVVAGSSFAAGQVLYRIAPDDPAWVIASVYQADLPQMHDGQIAMLGDPTSAVAARRGEVSFVYPDVHADTRAGQVRIEVPNADGALKPGMFVDVSVSVPLGRRLAVPESAVLPTGERNVVFVDLGDGRLEPRNVTLGARAGEWIEVRSGLTEGERVVTSGNFLLAAESKLRSAAGKW